MKLKRFVAKDMREALTMVKDELGEDAIIMSNKRVAAGVEIVAGIESKVPLTPQALGQALGGRALSDDQVDLSGSRGAAALTYGQGPGVRATASGNGAGSAAGNVAGGGAGNNAAPTKNQAYAKSLIEILERQHAMSHEQGAKLSGDIANLAAHKTSAYADQEPSAPLGGPLGLGALPETQRGRGQGAPKSAPTPEELGRHLGVAAAVPSAKVAAASEVDFTPARIMPERPMPPGAAVGGDLVRARNSERDSERDLGGDAAHDLASPRIINPVNDGNEDMANDSMKKAGPSRIDPSLDEDADLFNTPPLPLSQQREFKNFFVKSKVKQEKDEYVSRAGIDSYRGAESDTVVRQDLEKMRAEVENIRKLLQFELAGLLQDNRSRNEPVKAMVFKLLHSVGFSDKVADSLVNRLSAEISFNDAWREIVSLLERAILVGDDDIVSKGGIVTLIGPAGVGKTTTLAKLAARFVMRYGPQRVAIVTADHYRIGAVEQIKTYGRIMGCATFAVKNLSELPQLLYTLSDKSLILVDTAGVGFKDERFNVQLTQLKQQASLQLKHYLVLPCTTQRKVLQHAYEHFAMVGLTGLILTKIDECQNLGDALSLCIEMKLPISYITDGQRVPEDLDIPNPSSLARRALAAVEDDAAQGLLPRGL